MIYGLRPFTLSGGADGGRPPRPPFLLDSLADTRCSARCFLTGDGVSPRACSQEGRPLRSQYSYTVLPYKDFADLYLYIGATPTLTHDESPIHRNLRPSPNDCRR